MNIVSYWVSNFIVDYSIYFISALAAFICLFIYDMNILTSGERGLMSFLLLILYGWSFIPFLYL